MSAFVVAVVQLLALQAGDAPPAPEVQVPAVPAPVDEAPPESTEPDDAAAAPAPETSGTDGAITPDANSDDDEWSMVNTLGATGCAVGGVLPAVSAVTALGLLYGGSACAPAAALTGVGAVVIGVPAFIALAPCAVGGVACGAAVGAVLDDEEPGVAASWTLPGLVVGTAGGALAAAGLVVANGPPETFAAGTAMVAVGGLLALAGGPLAIAGASLTRTPAVPEDAEDPALDDDNAVDVVFVPAPMRF